jgi:hypothetical protein
MANFRSDMTVRIVPLHGAEASDSRVGGTVAERLALLTSLSERLWTLARRPLPVYTRATMPIVVSTLGSRSDRD